MKDVTTQDLVNRLILTAKATERATCVVKINPTGANAAKVRGAQRAERAALTALNRHLKMCIATVKKNTRK